MENLEKNLVEKIDEILANHAHNIKCFEEEKSKLINKINFFSEHNFEEEKRIAKIKFDAFFLILHEYKNIHYEIEKAIQNNNS